MATYGDPQIQNITEITSSAGEPVLQFATPSGATGNLLVSVPDGAMPAAVIQVESTEPNSDLVLLGKGTSGFSVGNESVLTGGQMFLAVGAEDSTPANGLQVTATNAGSAVRVKAVSDTETDVTLEIGGQGAGFIHASQDIKYSQSPSWIKYPKTFAVTTYIPSGFSSTPIFTAPLQMVLLHAVERHATAGTDGSPVWLNLTIDDSGTAIGGGSPCLTNNTNNGFDMKGTANTVQTGTFSGTPGVTLTANQTISAKFSGVTTSLAGVFVTLCFAYYD